MTRLELIMTDARPPLGPDDVEALLRRAPRPTPPDDMVAKVRARLAAEKAAASAPPAETPSATSAARPSEESADENPVERPVLDPVPGPTIGPGTPSEAREASGAVSPASLSVIVTEAPSGAPTPSRTRRFAVEGFAVLAAAAALAIGIFVGRELPREGNPAAEAAGIAAQAGPVVDVHLRAPALEEALIRRLALEAGLLVNEADGSVRYEGGAHEVRRFLVQLRVEAARSGGEVRGFVPDAGRLRVTVSGR